MTPSQIVSRLATVLAGDAAPDNLGTIPVDSIPPAYRPAYDAIMADAGQYGTVNADRILEGANGGADSLRGIFLELLDRAAAEPEATTEIRPIVPRSAVRYATDEIPDPEPLIEGVLPALCVLLVYALEKIGKTFLLMQLAFALAAELDFLGFKIRGKHRVLFLSPEGSDPTLKKRILDSIPYAGVEDDALERVFFASTLGALKVDDPKGERIILQWAKDFQVDVLILDSVFRFIGKGDENSHADARAFQDVLDRFKAAGLTVICSHHSRKPGDSDRGTAEVRGAGWAQYADAILKLSKSKSGLSPRYYIDLSLRHYEEPQQLELTRSGPLFALSEMEEWAVPPQAVRELLDAHGGRIEGKAALIKMIREGYPEASERAVTRAIFSAENQQMVLSVKRQGPGQGRVYLVPEGGAR